MYSLKHDDVPPGADAKEFIRALRYSDRYKVGIITDIYLNNKNLILLLKTVLFYSTYRSNKGNLVSRVSASHSNLRH